MRRQNRHKELVDSGKSTSEAAVIVDGELKSCDENTVQEYNDAIEKDIKVLCNDEKDASLEDIKALHNRSITILNEGLLAAQKAKKDSLTARLAAARKKRSKQLMETNA